MHLMFGVIRNHVMSIVNVVLLVVAVVAHFHGLLQHYCWQQTKISTRKYCHNKSNILVRICVCAYLEFQSLCMFDQVVIVDEI